MQLHRRTLLTLVALVTACAGGGGAGSGPQRPSSGESGGGAGGAAPDFTLDDVAGNEFHLASRLGQDVILLNFWATWCEPCRVEMPHLDRFQQTYGDRGLRILAIAMDGPESVARVRSHVGRYNYSFTVLLDQESEATQLYNPRGAAPLNVLIDRTGAIAWTHEGYAPGDEEELEEQIQAALGDSQ